MSDHEAPEQQPQSELFPEYVPDYTDSAVWIRVETPELIRLGRDAGNDEGREVLSGRTISTYRKRTPEDGTAEFIREQPKKSTARAIEEEGIYWPTWGQTVKVDPRIRHNSGPAAYRSLRETGGPNGHYNENVQRWNETAE